MTWPASVSDEEHEVDICLSFAAPERPYVSKVADELVRLGVRVFYDDFEKERLWGKDLYEYLSFVYSKMSRFCILFASKSYAERVWTNHERRNAQERALRENDEYILPVLFDDTEIPGLRSTIAFLDARTESPEAIARYAKKKLVQCNGGTISHRALRFYTELCARSPSQRGAGSFRSLVAT